MELKDVQKGMWIESQHGIGKVLVIDRASEFILVEPLGSDTQWALAVEEVEDELQLHNGCDQYY